MRKSFPFTSWVYRDITVYPPTELDGQVECGLSIPMTPPVDHHNPEHVECLLRYLDRAKELGMEQVCAFAILQTAELFVMEDSDVLWQAEYILRENKAFLHQVVSPQEHKIYQYQTEDISERFFMEERAGDLKEVSFDEIS